MSGQKSQIDRYYIEMEGDICGPVLMERVDSNGEWVRYEDHKAEIETLTRKLDTCGLECSEGLRRLAAENERLKREAAEARDLLNSEWFQRVTYKQQVRELQRQLDEANDTIIRKLLPPLATTQVCPACGHKSQAEIAYCCDINASHPGKHRGGCPAQPPGDG
jgi:excinuclease UvrABC ATPase subunit